LKAGIVALLKRCTNIVSSSRLRKWRVTVRHESVCSVEGWIEAFL